VNSPNLPPEESGPEGTEPPPDEILAGEFVLGVLDVPQHRDAQARVERDRAFAQRVAEWERRLAPWLSEIQPVEPPAQVWTRICLRLGWQDSDSPPVSFWQSLSFWRAATVLSMVVAVAAIVWTLQVVRTPPPQPPSVAREQPSAPAEAGANPVTPLDHDDGTPGWLASVDLTHGTVLMVPVPTAPDPQGRVTELWLIPAGKAPRSLGLVSIDKSNTVTVPEDVRAALVAGSVLAVTLESAAGVPHSAPTGPIIAKGAIQAQGPAS
jgi:anti-sigma-K factor RskA